MSNYFLLPDGVSHLMLPDGGGDLLLPSEDVDGDTVLGGTFNDPYEYARKGRESLEAAARQEAVREKQEEIIRLKLEAQALRTQELAIVEAKDKQTQRQLMAMQRRQMELADDIAQMITALKLIQNTKEQRNMEALMVLSLAYPWMNIGGTMH